MYVELNSVSMRKQKNQIQQSCPNVEGVAVPLTDGVRDGLCESDGVVVMDAVGDKVDVVVADGVLVSVADLVGEDVEEGEAVAVGDWVVRLVAVEVRVTVMVGCRC